MSGKTPTTRRLVELARQADKDAIAKLFEKAYPRVLQAARFRLGPALRSRMDTMDLAQTAYHAAFRDLSKYRYEGKGSFSRWLLGILENKIRSNLDFFRAKRRDVRREEALDPMRQFASSAPSPTLQLIANEDRERLEAAMDRLPEKYREVIVCRYYLSMPWAEVGQHMGGRTEEAAQMLCKRALARLRQLYGG